MSDIFLCCLRRDVSPFWQLTIVCPTVAPINEFRTILINSDTSKAKLNLLNMATDPKPSRTRAESQSQKFAVAASQTPPKDL